MVFIIDDVAIAVVGVVCGGLGAARTVSEIRKNWRDSSRSKHNDDLAMVLQADRYKFEQSIKTFERQQRHRTQAIREIERTRAETQRHAASMKVLEIYDRNRLTAQLSTNELLQALDRSRRISQSQFNEAMRDLIYTWRDERVMFLDRERTNHQTISLLLVIIIGLAFQLGQYVERVRQLTRLLSFGGAIPYFSEDLGRTFPVSDKPITKFFFYMLLGAGLWFMWGISKNLVHSALMSINEAFDSLASIITHLFSGRGPAPVFNRFVGTLILVALSTTLSAITHELSYWLLRTFFWHDPAEISAILVVFAIVFAAYWRLKFQIAVCAIGAVVAGSLGYGLNSEAFKAGLYCIPYAIARPLCKPEERPCIVRFVCAV